MTNHPINLLTLFGWAMHGAGAGLLVVVGIAFYAAVFAPLNNARESDVRQSEMLMQRIRGATDVCAEQQRLVRAINESERQSQVMRECIPDQPEETEFLDQVSGAAEECGIVIQDYRREGIAPQADHSVLKLIVIGSGDYQAICRLLAKLESLPRMSQLDSLRITADGDAGKYIVEIGLSLLFGLDVSA